MRALLLLLVLAAAAYATAPGWVAKGASLNYSAGTDTISFTVLERNSSDIRIQIKLSSAQNPYTGVENASGQYGQFWFDKDQFSNPEGFSVVGQSSQSFAGKSWNTITLQGMVSGAQTTRVYDKDSGLMLKQTVGAPGAPVVTLMQYYVPNWQAPAPPPPPPSAPPPANGSAPPPSSPPSTPPPTTPPSATPPSSTPPSSTPPSVPPSGEPFWPEEEPEPEQGPCCLPAFMLGALGFAVFLNNRGQIQA